jgi:hypothetical protein
VHEVVTDIERAKASELISEYRASEESARLNDINGFAAYSRVRHRWHEGSQASDKPVLWSEAAGRKLIYIVGRKVGHEHLGGIWSRRMGTYNLPVSIGLPPNCPLKLLSIPKLQIYQLALIDHEFLFYRWLSVHEV